jgi:hypothetical protein
MKMFFGCWHDPFVDVLYVLYDASRGILRSECRHVYDQQLWNIGMLDRALMRQGRETFRMLAASTVVSSAFSGMIVTPRPGRHGFQNVHQERNRPGRQFNSLPARPSSFLLYRRPSTAAQPG